MVIVVTVLVVIPLLIFLYKRGKTGEYDNIINVALDECVLLYVKSTGASTIVILIFPPCS